MNSICFPIFDPNSTCLKYFLNSTRLTWQHPYLQWTRGSPLHVVTLFLSNNIFSHRVLTKYTFKLCTFKIFPSSFHIKIVQSFYVLPTQFIILLYILISSYFPSLALDSHWHLIIFIHLFLSCLSIILFLNYKL